MDIDYKARLEEITVRLLRDTSKWPMITHLCVKKPNDMPDGVWPKTGVIRERSYSPLSIVVQNHPDKLQGQFVEKFGSIDELLAAGWVVD